MTLRMLRIPGTFVCLQGLPGDGRRNTVQCPSLPDDDDSDDGDGDSFFDCEDDDDDDDENSQKQETTTTAAAAAAQMSSSTATATATALLSAAASSSPAYAAMHSAFPHLRFPPPQQQQQQQLQESSPDSSTAEEEDATTTRRRVPPSSSVRDGRRSITSEDHHEDDDDKILRDWHEQCVESARSARHEWRQASLSLNTHCLLNNNNSNHSSINSNNSNNNLDVVDNGTNTATNTETTAANNNNNNSNRPVLAILGETDQQPWWLTPDGDLAVFEAMTDNGRDDEAASPAVLDFQNVRTVGSLAPGSTVDCVALCTVDSRHPAGPLANAPPVSTFAPSSGGGDTDTQIFAPGRAGQMQILQLQPLRSSSPSGNNNNDSNNINPRYVVASVDGYPYLLPGCLEHYAASAQQQPWWWMVTCVEGAYVRAGLDLGTRHLATLPLGTLVQVRRKVVNAMGLARLHIQAVVSAAPDCDNNNDSEDHGDEIVEGWCSEFLNPLSGQRGTVLMPLPLPVPAIYRTTRPDVPIRSNVEPASAVVGCAHAVGTRLAVVARQFSESSISHCAACYQLAGDGGWVAVEDVEFVCMDESFDPNRPGRYHLEALRRVRLQMEQQQRDDDDDSAVDVEEEAAAAAAISPSASSSMDGVVEEPFSADESLLVDTSVSSSSSGGGSPSHYSQQQISSALSSPFSSPMYLSPVRRRTSSRRSSNHPNNNSNKEDSFCLICLSEARTATMVHGETGHVACCLCCARILKARGDPCPVCRMPIDLVIQHFWA